MKIYACYNCKHRIGCQTEEHGLIWCKDCVIRGFCFKKPRTSKEVDKTLMCSYCREYIKITPLLK
jgi:uncharacterized CHY-type Zn-finger protein